MLLPLPKYAQIHRCHFQFCLGAALYGVVHAPISIWRCERSDLPTKSAGARAWGLSNASSVALNRSVAACQTTELQIASQQSLLGEKQETETKWAHMYCVYIAQTRASGCQTGPRLYRCLTDFHPSLCQPTRASPAITTPSRLVSFLHRSPLHSPGYRLSFFPPDMVRRVIGIS